MTRPVRSRGLTALAFGVGIATCLSAFAGAPATAAESSTMDVLSALEQVPSKYGLFEDLEQPDSVARSAGAPTTSVALDATQPLTATSEFGSDLAISLPQSVSTNATATALDGGLVAFDHGDGSTTVPLKKAGGSVQIATVIANNEAPSNYRYELDLPEGSKAEVQPEGSVVIWDKNGEYIGGVVAPWAVDANGIEVPTSFVVDGSTLIQHVNHEDSSAYPVVADPWLGVDLWQTTYYNRDGLYKSQLVVSALFSSYGWGLYSSGGAGIGIMAGAGWDELKTKRPLVLNKSSMKHQYDCHVTFGYAWWWAGFHWDLEQVRVDKAGWLSSAPQHRCNW